MSTVKSFDPELLETRDVHRLLSSSIAPRPIAFASTIDSNGNVNLSPFSFFKSYLLHSIIGKIDSFPERI